MVVLRFVGYTSRPAARSPGQPTIPQHVAFHNVTILPAVSRIPFPKSPLASGTGNMVKLDGDLDPLWQDLDW